MKFNFSIEQAATFLLVVYWKEKTGRGVDTRGYSFRLQARSTPDDSVALLDLSTANGHITTDLAQGAINITVPDDEDASYAWRTAVYDLYAYAPDGTSERMLQGVVRVSPAVTRPS
jgi:hypothetical protein